MRTARPRSSGIPTLNGIDYLEVLDHDAIPLDSPRQQTLLVHCLNSGADRADARERPDHGRRKHHRHHRGVDRRWPSATAGRKPLRKESAYFTALADAANVLVDSHQQAGRLLALHAAAGQQRQRRPRKTPSMSPKRSTGFDPQLAEVEFSFKVECRSDFRLRPATCRLPAGSARAAADQLSGEGLRIVPHASCSTA